jgi:hypothetical protein
MIHHFSISARNTAHAASVLAEILNGRSFPFGSVPGSHIAITEDGHGTAIEVYPAGVELAPGTHSDPLQTVANPHSSHFSATHAAISVDKTEDELRSIAEREGWRALHCDRGPFRVVEFWLENRLLIELLTPEMAADYLLAMKLERWAEPEAATSRPR